LAKSASATSLVVSQQGIFVTEFDGRDEKQKVINLHGLF